MAMKCKSVVALLLIVTASVFASSAMAGGPCGPGSHFVVDHVYITPEGTEFVGHCAPNSPNHPPNGLM